MNKCMINPSVWWLLQKAKHDDYSRTTTDRFHELRNTDLDFEFIKIYK